MNLVALAFIALVLDALIGDPPTWPHPIRWIGKLISTTEKRLRRVAKTATHLYLSGAILWAVVVGTTFAITWSLIWLAYSVADELGYVVETWLALTVLAGKCLKDCAKAVLTPLSKGDIQEARTQLSYIVGRDTTQLENDAITRGTVETVAENTVDGVIAPLMFLFIGGVPLAMAYKAVNTLDSMVGYKNDKYRELGFVSAKLDDVANWIPARLTWLLMSAAAVLLNLNWRNALAIGWRDRHNHKSPNSGWSESTVAGALGIRLGGPNIYFGEKVDKPWIGDEVKPVDCTHILDANRILTVSSWLAFVVFSIVYTVVS